MFGEAAIRNDHRDTNNQDEGRTLPTISTTRYASSISFSGRYREELDHFHIRCSSTRQALFITPFYFCTFVTIPSSLLSFIFFDSNIPTDADKPFSFRFSPEALLQL
jgi:hypothetical protein